MPLLRILGRKSTQVSNTTNAAEVDASKDTKRHQSLSNVTEEDTPSVYSREVTTTKDPSLNPGTLSFEEGTHLLAPRLCSIDEDQYRCCWGNGPPLRRLQLHHAHVSSSPFTSSLSSNFVSVGRIIGTGIFSTPSSILSSVGSVGASLMLWILGFLLSFCGLFVWLEYGTMFPRSGGEKVYLEAVYKRPKYLATVIFAVNAIVLGFTAAGCIVRTTGSSL
jgi:L-type amino acid transporter 9